MALHIKEQKGILNLRILKYLILPAKISSHDSRLIGGASKMANMQTSFTCHSQRPACFRSVGRRNKFVPKAAAQATDDLGFKMMRRGVKEASNETLLSPRFYTTDFDAMENMFS